MDKVVYYNDELNDDFEISSIKPISINGDYKYIHKNVFWNIWAFFVHRIIATPLAYLFMKLRFDLKFENKDILKEYKNIGYFIYFNHTQLLGDAFIPSILSLKKKPYVVVNPSNVSQPFIGKIIKLLGPLPVPDDIEAGKNFSLAMKKIIEDKKSPVIIYPEAHVWRYYTKIRPYGTSSFKYPIKYKVPAFAATVTYRARKNKVPRIVVYIDGPYFPDEKIPSDQKRKNLRDKVYSAMLERAKTNNVEYIKYIKKEENV